MKSLRPATRIAHGHSLIELLIAMALGMALIVGALQLFVNARATQSEMAARQRMLEGARLAISFIGDELRMAGYLGCFGSLGQRRINSILDAPPASLQPWFGLQGWEFAGTALRDTIPSAANSSLVRTSTHEWSTLEAGHVLPDFDALPNSDILRTWNVEGTPSAVIEVNQVPPSFRLRSTPDISLNDFVLVSDCARADIVQACAITQQTASTLMSVSSSCSPGNKPGVRLVSLASEEAPAEAMRIQGNIFYIGKRGADAANPPALFRRSLRSDGLPKAAEELVEGVESMQLMYGVRQENGGSGGIQAYLTADKVEDFSKVVSVRLNLLMQSIDYSQATVNQDYEFNGVVYAGSGEAGLTVDRRLRRGFTSTYYLRNRGLGL